MITETKPLGTQCQYVGLPESVADLTNRWLNI